MNAVIPPPERVSRIRSEMPKRVFTVTAVWDEEAHVFYSVSDIIGLHIEADTLDGFEALMVDLAPKLVVENHYTEPELATLSLEELIPTIVWRRPLHEPAAA
jgi:hypothetical protein